MNKIRVLVVDDSVTVRKYLAEIIQTNPQFELVGEAEDGKRAIELTERLRPDVISLDMILPVMSGLTATEYIMAYFPTPILVVSSSTNRGELFKTYDALSAGAVDVLEKVADIANKNWPAEYLAALKRVSRIKVITHPRARMHLSPAAAKDKPASQAPAPSSQYQYVAIGASTGGPAAVIRVLTGLPSDFPLPIFLLIHIGAPFGYALADWLDGLSPIRVAVAADGDPLPQPGRPKVILAPHERHLIVEKGHLHLHDGPERFSCKPSVDVLFESIAKEIGRVTIACLLTGMGRDGGRGMLAIRKAGGMTLAQNETTCTVFGMPREAIDLGAAQQVLSLDEFAPTLLALAGRGRFA